MASINAAFSCLPLAGKLAIGGVGLRRPRRLAQTWGLLTFIGSLMLACEARPTKPGNRRIGLKIGKVYKYGKHPFPCPN